MSKIKSTIEGIVRGYKNQKKEVETILEGKAEYLFNNKDEVIEMMRKKVFASKAENVGRFLYNTSHLSKSSKHSSFMIGYILEHPSYFEGISLNEDSSDFVC